MGFLPLFFSFQCSAILSHCPLLFLADNGLPGLPDASVGLTRPNTAKSMFWSVCHARVRSAQVHIY